MAGRRPIPTALKLLRGNPGKRPIDAREPQLEPVVLTPPAFLSPVAKAEFRRVAVKLKKACIATAIDRAGLAGYAAAYEMFSTATAAVEEHGLIQVSPSGRRSPSAYFTVAMLSLATLRQFAVEFGLTPASRSRVKATGPEKKDPIQELMDRKFFGKRDEN